VAEPAGAFAVRVVGAPLEGHGVERGVVALPVRTRLIERGDDIAELVAAAVSGIARPGDVVAVAETAVAIAQGRLIPAETVRPGKLALFLAPRAGAASTVNQPESLQIVIDKVGAPKVVIAALLQVVGRFIGVRGGFYRVLGETIAEIDGYTGTLPPYETTIVLGPEAPDRIASEIAKRLGTHALIVDANDLGIAKILGASPGVSRANAEAALRHNPHGNGDEQTPIVVLKWRGMGPSPLGRAA
jgi:F420-0:gamma-glutamyl ligase